MADTKKFSPTAAALSAKLTEHARRIADGGIVVDPDIQSRLAALRPRDIDAIRPPGVGTAGGVWVNDAGFCRRLGELVFDVSEETVDELSIRDYQVLQAVIYANFTHYMEH